MRMRGEKGMVLVELMMAGVFCVLLTAGTFAFASFFRQAQHEYRSHVELTNDARIVLEKMVWGEKVVGQAERRGIAEAASGTITSPTQLDYTDRSGVQHTLRLNGDDIEYRLGSAGAWRTILDPGGSGDPAQYTTSLAFVQPLTPNSVEVRVVVGKKILDKWYYGSVSTHVFYRNA